MFCPTCGTQNSDTAAFCSNCGTALKPASPNPDPVPPPSPVPPPNYSARPNPQITDDPGADTIIKVISFCVPLVGLILYFVWNRDKPRSARDACTFAAIGFGAGLVLYLFMAVVADIL